MSEMAKQHADLFVPVSEESQMQILHELYSELLKGGYVGDDMGEYYRGLLGRQEFSIDANYTWTSRFRVWGRVF